MNKNWNDGQLLDDMFDSLEYLREELAELERRGFTILINPEYNKNRTKFIEIGVKR